MVDTALVNSFQGGTARRRAVDIDGVVLEAAPQEELRTLPRVCGRLF